jgi:hypothetical protein
MNISTIADLPPQLLLEWMRRLRDGKLTPSPTCASPGKVASAKAEMWPLRQTNADATRQPSSVRADGGFYMSANIIRLLPDEERALLDCYVTGSDQPASFQQLFDTGGPQQRNAGSLQIAVAQILLHHVQDSLPQWAAIYARLQFTPRLLFSINWATQRPRL